MNTLQNVPTIGEYLVDAWSADCGGFTTEDLQTNCIGNSGVYRVATVTSLFYLFAALVAYCKPTSNREAWTSKIFLFLVGVVGSIFIPNTPLFTDIYLQVGRIGGIFFVVFQQLILLDISYNLNESWVRRADEADSMNPGSGKKWLISIVVTCAVLYIGSFVVIGLLFFFYSGCASNETFISLTLIISILMTIVQLRGEEASLLTSAVLTAYGTYLVFVAVSKNPNEECNPYLRERDILGVVLGIIITIISLTWTGWSNTTNKVFKSEGDDMDIVREENSVAVTGIVIASDEEKNEKSLSEPNDSERNENTERISSETSNIWKMNIVLFFITCWFSMALTGWGSIQGGGNLANPDVHNVSMWMIIVSQWIMFSMYLWTLLAPTLLPNRDFS